MSWDYKTLDELGEISRGKSKHRPRNDPSLFGGAYPFIQTADVKNAEFYLTEYSETYNEKGLQQSKLWPKGTLCITIAANIADTAILGIDACFPDSIMGFIPYSDKANVKFIKYAFDILQKDCKQISQGAAQDNLSWEKLSTIKFPAPPIEIQNKIASVLSAYDDLIENNRHQIKLLEEAARRLYREWFVDFRFPGHEQVQIVDGVPEGWEKKKLTDIADIQYGYAFDGSLFNNEKRGIPILRIRNIPQGTTEDYTTEDAPEQYIVHNGDIVVGINDVVSRYIEPMPHEQAVQQSGRYDISHIDFDRLRAEFLKIKRKNLLLRDLKMIVEERLDQMISENPQRVNFYDRYQQIIEAYNAKQDRADIEKTFQDLMDLSEELDEETQRFVREGFDNEEELAMYDLLFKDALTKEEIKQLKSTARELLQRVKEAIHQMHNWREKEETKANVEKVIRNVLYMELPQSYDDQAMEQCRKQIFTYVYDAYPAA